MSQKKQKEIDLESLTPEETGRIGGIMTRKKREKIKNQK